MNKTIAAIFALLLILTGGVVGYLLTKSPATVSPQPPDTATRATTEAMLESAEIVAFSLNDIDGEQRQLKDWQGKARLINFWATWCAPCRREIPLLKATQDRHADDNIQVIGVAVDFQEDVEEYAEEAKFNYPILVGQEDAMAAAETSGVEFLGLPFTMIVAPSGELLKTHVGEIVETHIALIVEVFQGLENGSLDIADARAELSRL